MKRFDSFLDLVRTRYSTRRFQDQPVAREIILSCIEAARLAPSAENVQPWRFLVLDDPELLSRVAKAAFSGIYRPSRFAARAPVLIVLLAKLDILANRIGAGIQGTQYYLLDLGIAGEHLVLRATELGLGACWIGWFNAKGLRRCLDIPDKYRIVALLALGYPEDKPTRPRPKLPIEKIAWFNSFQGE